MSEIPPAFKSISSLLKKGEELSKDTSNPDSKIVAFSCTNFALEKALKLKVNDSESKKFLLSLLEKLEADKKQITISPAERKMICERFAFRVFAIADEEDRAGEATKETARTFNAAATFFDILEQFGELSEEIVEKRKYAKFKTLDIVTALREGRKPPIGAPGDKTEESAEGALQWGSANVTSPGYVPGPPPILAPTGSVLPPFPAEQKHPATSSTPPVAQNLRPAVSPAPAANMPPARRPSLSGADQISKDATELCYFAAAAVKASQTALARERLTEALRRLETLPKDNKHHALVMTDASLGAAEVSLIAINALKKNEIVVAKDLLEQALERL